MLLCLHHLYSVCGRLTHEWAIVAGCLRFTFRGVSTRTPIERLKFPERGGQNLSERYHRLERSLRGREALLRAMDRLPTQPQRTPAAAAAASSKPPRSENAVETICGFVVPQVPKPPEPDECCMSGCAICVHDLYRDSLAAYDESLTALRSRLVELRLPEAEWPLKVRVGQGTKGTNEDVAMSAFEELERRLKEKEKGLDDSPGEHRRVDIASIYEGFKWLLLGHR